MDGVCAAAGQLLMALAEAIPPPVTVLGSFSRTPNREQLPQTYPYALYYSV